VAGDAQQSRAALSYYPSATEFDLDNSAALRGVHAFRREAFFQSRQFVRHCFPRAPEFRDASLNERVALARIVVRLFHLVDQFGEVAAAHLLCHSSSVSRSVLKRISRFPRLVIPFDSVAFDLGAPITELNAVKESMIDELRDCELAAVNTS
jgi:hypothetical protein